MLLPRLEMRRRGCRSIPRRGRADCRAVIWRGRRRILAILTSRRQRQRRARRRVASLRARDERKIVRNAVIAVAVDRPAVRIERDAVRARVPPHGASPRPRPQTQAERHEHAEGGDAA